MRAFWRFHKSEAKHVEIKHVASSPEAEDFHLLSSLKLIIFSETLFGVRLKFFYDSSSVTSKFPRKGTSIESRSSHHYRRYAFNTYIQDEIGTFGMYFN